MTNNIFLAVANLFIDSNGHTTTLEVKNYIRKVIPGFYCVQADVSNALDEAQDAGLLSYQDMGTHRLYSKAEESIELTGLELAGMIVGNIGKPIYVEFKEKKDNALRKMDCVVTSYNILGRAFAEEAGNPKSFYLSRVKLVKIGNITYVRK